MSSQNFYNSMGAFDAQRSLVPVSPKVAHHTPVFPIFCSKWPPITNAAFVTEMYMDILGHVPDAGGLAYWQSLLAAGVSRGAVIGAILNSDEANLVLIDGSYLNILHHAPDPHAK